LSPFRTPICLDESITSETVRRFTTATKVLYAKD
jgi:hypothetical protein